jgi:hypothetical protein
MTEIKEYISHDYTSLNQQIDELANREKRFSEALHLKNQKKRIKNFTDVMKYVCLGFLAIGLLALLIAVAIRLIIYKPAYKDIEIIRPEVVTQTIERERIIEREAGSRTSDSEQIRRINEGEQNNPNNQSPNTATGRVVENFTKFITVPISNISGINEVTTGRRYSSENDTFPDHQYCYVLKPVYGQAGPVRITLAAVDKNGKIESEINSNTSSLASIEISKLYDLEKNCRFLKKI